MRGRGVHKKHRLATVKLLEKGEAALQQEQIHGVKLSTAELDGKIVLHIHADSLFTRALAYEAVRKHVSPSSVRVAQGR